MENRLVPQESRLPIAERLRTRPGIAAVLGFVALVTLALYLPTLRYDFVWDDVLLITDNPLLARSTPLEIFRRGFWAGSEENLEGPALSYYRPLTTLSFWLDLHIAGRNARFFHLVNGILAAIVSAIVTLIIWELLHSGIWAGLGGLLFATHSSHVESVAFISGRTDLLLALFCGLAGFALLRSIRKHNPWWWLVVILGFTLALLAKETAILFPMLVALAPPLTLSRYPRRYWLVLGAVLLVALLYLLLRVGVVHQALPLASGMGLKQRLANVVNTFGLYLKMFFWPFDHRVKFPVDPTFLHLTPNFLYSLLFAVSVPLLALRRRYWVCLWGYFWTIVFLLPVVNIVPIGPQAAERLLFLPSAGLVMILMTLFSRLLTTRVQLRAAVAGALGVLIIILAGDSIVRSRIWQNEGTLFSTMVREAPKAPSAYANLANFVRPTHPDSAIRLYNRAVLLDQGYVQAHINLGILYSQQADHRRALHHLRLANELRPNSASILTDLGFAFLAAGELDSALNTFARACELAPELVQPALGHALALGLKGRTVEAGTKLSQALRVKPELITDLRELAQRLRQEPRPTPTHPLYLTRLGTLLAATGDTVLAETLYLRALALDTSCVPALYNQAVLFLARGDTGKARLLTSRALGFRPDLEALQSLNKVLTHPR
ncbi:MAG: tetratricopeptide repeat protein [candidate division WOR-3 bacterium]